MDKREKHKHFNVFECSSSNLEIKLNELYLNGYNVVQVVNTGHQTFVIITIKIPKPGDLMDTINIDLQNLPQKL